MQRFVILHHVLPLEAEQATHWDLMLETDDVLRTWSLDNEPTLAEANTGEAIADHRKQYLIYQGPISNNRGHVTQIDRGEYQILEESPVKMIVKLSGTKFVGELELAIR
ncbi:MAG: hypothetical protein COA78_10785 [Blastopirellula sp.]|nr:MAG: hypothetical protein COA78_10785 [Blastopirellula sp.]